MTNLDTEGTMEVLLLLALTIGTLALLDVLYGTGILITAIQAGTRHLWRRHPPHG